MSDTEEMEEQVNEVIHFSVQRQGEETPIGPYTQEELLQRIQTGELSKEDFVYYEGIPGWEPIGEVFNFHQQISHFVDDGQNQEKVAEIFEEVTEILSQNEEIYYIALQERAGLLSKGRTAIILTNKRLLFRNEHKHGSELDSHPWTTISNTLMKDEGGEKGLGTFSALLQLEKRHDVTHLPMRQVRRLFQLSQELRE